MGHGTLGHTETHKAIVELLEWVKSLEENWPALLGVTHPLQIAKSSAFTRGLESVILMSEWHHLQKIDHQLLDFSGVSNVGVCIHSWVSSIVWWWTPMFWRSGLTPNLLNIQMNLQACGVSWSWQTGLAYPNNHGIYHEQIIIVRQYSATTSGSFSSLTKRYSWFIPRWIRVTSLSAPS